MSKDRDFDTKTEVRRNIIGGGVGCTLGYLIGYLADSQLLSFVLFFVVAYLGYNVRTIVPSFKKHFIPVMQAFWKGLCEINPHPILALSAFAYFGCWLFAAGNTDTHMCSTWSWNGIWEGVAANYTWWQTGFNPLSFENTGASSLRRNTVFWVWIIGSAGMGACFWFICGWILKGTFWCIRHPLQALKAVFTGFGKAGEALWRGMEKNSPHPVIATTVALWFGLKFFPLLSAWMFGFIAPDQLKGINIIATGLLSFAASGLVWMLIGPILDLLKDGAIALFNIALTLTWKKTKHAARLTAYAVYLTCFYCTIGLVIALVKGLALTLMGIHSVRRLACGLSALGSGAVYMIFVPFSIGGVPVAALAIGCGIVGGCCCALVAIALDGATVYNALDGFVQRPTKTFAPGIN